MIPVSALKATYCSNTHESLAAAYKSLNVHDGLRLLAKNIHPPSLPKEWYPEVVETLPHKLYLFEPNHVSFVDLVTNIVRHTNVELYADHIHFYKNSILQTCTKDVVTKCVRFMTLYDDDIRYLRNRFYNVDTMLVDVNADSIRRLSYVFSDELTERILVQDYTMYDYMYEHQFFTYDFLTDMLYRYGIVPNNDGILEHVSIEGVLEILQSIRVDKDIFCFLDRLPKELLHHADLKAYVLQKIQLGVVQPYVPYAKEYLTQEDVGVYANIVFENAVVDLTLYALTKTELKTICSYIHKYEYFTSYIVDLLMKDGYIDLLASILDYVPAELLTEEICIRLVCESPTKVRIKQLPVHSSLIMAVCIQMGYDDLVDLLDEIDVATLLDKQANVLTAYSLTTNWYNDRRELLDEYITSYGFCSYKMNKLMFEYPLTPESIHYVFVKMDTNKKATLFYPTIVSSLFYLACSTYKLKTKKITGNKMVIPCKKLVKNDTESFCVDDEDSIRSVILYSNVPNVRIPLDDIGYETTRTGIRIQFNKYKEPYLTSGDDIITQLGTIGRLALYGLIYVPHTYFPSWIPVTDLVRGTPYTAPSKIEHGVVYKTYPTDFVEYKSLGRYVSNVYALSEPVSNFHAVINSFIQTLLLYIVIGSKYSIKNTDEFIQALVNSFFTGMKINEILTENITLVCSEVNRVKSYVQDEGFVIIKKNYLKETISLCEHICAAIIIDNCSHFDIK
ncbi:m28L [Myxoma virus]|uniref:M28L n=1 Tax=Myxoma virus TaxID=10273 RepID=K4JBZ1_9POXV|nr:m28L [Myxoma virus]QAV34341.1 m28L [Myxoma virus]QAV34679.1 m28L [Myxoma virus]QAV34848.1 m28L [Myxoma virus]QAV35017.1 m28L [Myxoma virus]